MIQLQDALNEIAKVDVQTYFTGNKRKLLSNGLTNAKLAKNELTSHVLYLAPYNQNSLGANLCKDATKGCAEACLFTAGRGFMESVYLGRMRKTEYFLKHRNDFFNKLYNELRAINKKAANETVAIRLNGTSDVDFIGIMRAHNFDLLNDFQNLHFYDYTKSIKRVLKYAETDNYTLTFSYSEDSKSESNMLTALSSGANVAAVFVGALPMSYKGFNVVDGDKSDLQMINYKRQILGLKAKGDAKKDTSGFVIRNY